MAGCVPLRAPGDDRDREHDQPDDHRDPAMQDVRRGRIGHGRQQRPAHERPVREDERGIRRGHMRAEEQQGERRERPEGRQQREPLARAATADAGREAGTDRDVDQQPDQRHRGGQMRGDRLAGVAEADGLAPEPGLEADQQDGADARPQDRSAVAVIADGQDGQPEDLEPDDDRDAPVDPLDPGLGVVEGRQQLAVAERPVRAAEPGVGRTHDHADRHEGERGQQGRQGQALEARHETAILAPRRRIPAVAATLSAMSRPRSLATLLALVLTVAACGSTTPTATPSTPPSAGPSAATTDRCATAPEPASMEGWEALSQAPTVFPSLITNPLLCGSSRMLISLLDKDNVPVAGPDRPLKAAFFDLAKDLKTPVTTVDGTFAWAIEGSRGFYIFDVDLPEAGHLRDRVHDAGARRASRDDPRDVDDPPGLVDGEGRRPGACLEDADRGRCRWRPLEDLDRRQARPGLLQDVGRGRPRRPHAVHPRVRDAQVLHERPVRADARRPQADRGGAPRGHVHQRRALHARGRERPAPARPRRTGQPPGHAT